MTICLRVKEIYREVESAANAAHQRKIAKYESVIGNAGTLVPFVVESSGKLSTHTSKFVDMICGLSGPLQVADESKAAARRFFLRRLSTIIARCNAKKVF